MATTINNESLVNRVPLAEADVLWYGILGIMPFNEEFRKQEYVQQCTKREADGLAAVLPTKDQLNSMMENLGSGNRELLNEALNAFKRSKSVGESTKA